MAGCERFPSLLTATTVILAFKPASMRGCVISALFDLLRTLLTDTTVDVSYVVIFKQWCSHGG